MCLNIISEDNFYIHIDVVLMYYFSQDNTVTALVPEGSSEEDAYLQYVDWRPQSTDLIFVFENDIRMRRIESSNENDILLTDSGVPG